MKKQNLSLFKDFSKYKNKLLKSVLFLYLVLIVVVTNLVTLFQKNDNESIVLFVIISTCTYFAFDKKNLVVALLTPLIIVNLLLFVRNQFPRKKLEGFFFTTTDVGSMRNKVRNCLEKSENIETGGKIKKRNALKCLNNMLTDSYNTEHTGRERPLEIVKYSKSNQKRWTIDEDGYVNTDSQKKIKNW